MRIMTTPLIIHEYILENWKSIYMKIKKKERTKSKQKGVNCHQITLKKTALEY